MAKFNTENIDKFYDYNIHIETRTIYMGKGKNGIDSYLAEKVIKGLHILEYKSEEPITIIMSNSGGEVESGFAIFDAIKSCKSHTTIIVYGNAYSMAGVVLQAANKRIMTENSRIMLHYGDFHISMNSHDAYKWVDESKRIDKWMEDLFLGKMKQKHPNITKKYMARKLKAAAK